MTKSDHKNVITKTTTHKIYLQRFIPWKIPKSDHKIYLQRFIPWKNPKSDHKIYLQRFIPWKNPNTSIYQKTCHIYQKNMPPTSQKYR